MIHATRFLSILVSLSLLTSGCGKPEESSGEGAPPAPPVPSHWQKKSDVDTRKVDIALVSRSLGAEITALRNTLYDVEGGTVQLNVIVAASEKDAEKLWSSLRTIKSDEALVRRQLVIYEFVGTDEVLPEIKKARDALLTDR